MGGEAFGPRHAHDAGPRAPQPGARQVHAALPPLSVRDFERRHSTVTMSRAGLAAVTEGLVRVALAEGFPGHAQSVLTRFEG